MPHPVIHFEIAGREPAKLMDFYRQAFGWNIDANNPMNYGVTDTQSGGIGGGIAPDGPAVTFYIEADDLRGQLDKVTSLGGTVVMDVTEIPGMVTMAKFADPDGNVIGLVKPVPPEGHGAPPR